MTSAAATATPGTVLKATDAGSVQVRIVKAAGGYTVQVWCGAEQVDGWTQGYGTRAATKAALDYAVSVFEAHGSEQGITRRYAHLIAEKNRLARLPSQRAKCAQIDDELDMLRDLATIAATGPFVTIVTARLAA